MIALLVALTWGCGRSETGSARRIQEFAPTSAIEIPETKTSPVTRTALPATRIRIHVDGSILLNDSPATVDEVFLSLSQSKACDGSVWYFRENPESAPVLEAVEIMDAIIHRGIPVMFSRDSGFSELQGPGVLPEGHFAEIQNKTVIFKAEYLGRSECLQITEELRGQMRIDSLEVVEVIKGELGATSIDIHPFDDSFFREIEIARNRPFEDKEISTWCLAPSHNTRVRLKENEKDGYNRIWIDSAELSLIEKKE
jgi:hypothetical protein